MRTPILTAITLCATLLFTGAANAQQPPPAPPNLDAIPDKMPNATPYGPPISLQKAQGAVQAAEAEANKRGWAMNIAVYDSGANLVSFRAHGRSADWVDCRRREQGARDGEISAANQGV